jgi:predicted Holliday junction resolvase-like endonuclease
MPILTWENFSTVAALLIATAVLFFLVKSIVWKMFGISSVLQQSRSETKSAEVRLAKVAEHLAPIMEDFPVDVLKPGTTTLFLGQPIDFVHFDPDHGITFIEVKSGSAKTSSKQKRLQALVESGQVHWREYRVRRAATDPVSRVRSSIFRRRRSP